MSFRNTVKPRGIPIEIVEEVFAYVTPWELIQLQISCRLFGYILEKQSIWRFARRCMVPPVPDPILPTDIDGFTRSWSEAAYANYIFGQTICTFCGDTLPFEQASVSFSLRERACGFKRSCYNTQASQRVPFPDINDTSKWPPFIADLKVYLPYAELPAAPSTFGEDERRYNYFKYKKAFAEALHEFTFIRDLGRGSKWRSDTDAMKEFNKREERVERKRAWIGPYMGTAGALFEWHKEYCRQVKHSGIRKINFDLANAIAKSESISFAVMERSETMRRCLLAHSRSQTRLSFATWGSIRQQVLREVADEKAGRIKLPLPNGWDKNVLCPFCPDREKPFVGGQPLKDHIKVVHRDLKDVVVMKSMVDFRTLIT